MQVSESKKPRPPEGKRGTPALETATGAGSDGEDVKKQNNPELLRGLRVFRFHPPPPLLPARSPLALLPGFFLRQGRLPRPTVR